MTDNPKPELTHRYHIVSPEGKIVSDRRPRASGAWFNAAHNLGIEGKVAIENAIIAMKKEGYACKRIESVNVHFGVGVSGGEILHMRLNEIDADRIAALVLHYSTKDHPVTKSWVIRHLIAEKVEKISKSKGGA